MPWNRVNFERAGEAYQEIDDYGMVVQYVDRTGRLLFKEPPIGDLCVVMEESSPPTLAMTAVANARVSAEVKVRTDRKNEVVTKAQFLVEALRVSVMDALKKADPATLETIASQFDDVLRLLAL
jgi:hypothetical protein